MKTCNVCNTPAAYRNLMSGEYTCLTDTVIRVSNDPFHALDMVALRPDSWYMDLLFKVAHTARIAFLTDGGGKE